MIIKKLIIPIVLLLIFPLSREGDGYRLLEKMKSRYDGKWYKTLTFEQQTTRYNDNGEVISDNVWYEALLMPDKLSIKFNDMKQGNGLIFRNDSLYQMQDGKVAGSRPMFHPLLVLGFSVYDQPVSKTATALNVLGFDLEKAYQREYEGRKVYVVGAKEGDETSNQFWIEKDRLLFVKMIQNFGEGRVQEVKFKDYQAIGDGWVATRIEFYNNNSLRLLEVYSNIKTPHLEASIFKPSAFQNSEWLP